MSNQHKHTLVAYYKPMSKEHEDWMFDHLDYVVLDISHKSYRLRAGRKLSGTYERPSITFTPTAISTVHPDGTIESGIGLDDIDPSNAVTLRKFVFKDPEPEEFVLELSGAHWDSERIAFHPFGDTDVTKWDNIGYNIVLLYKTEQQKQFEEHLRGVVLEQNGTEYSIYGDVRVHSHIDDVYYRVMIEDLYSLDQPGRQIKFLGDLIHNVATGVKTTLKRLIMYGDDVPARVVFADVDGASILVAMGNNNICPKDLTEDQKNTEENRNDTKALCPACVGSGMTNWYVGDKVRTEPCKVCAGSGYVNTEQFNAYVEKYGREHINSTDDKSKIRFVRFCQHCSGTGKIMRTDAGYEVEGKCLYCNGTGRITGYPEIRSTPLPPDRMNIPFILEEHCYCQKDHETWKVNGHDTGIPLEEAAMDGFIFERMQNGKPVTSQVGVSFDRHEFVRMLRAAFDFVMPDWREKTVQRLLAEKNLGRVTPVPTPIRDFMTGKTRQTPEPKDQQNKTIILRPVKDATTPLAHVQVHGVSKTQVDGLYKSIWTVAGGAHSVVSAQRVPDEQWTVVRSLTLSGTMCATDVEIMKGGTVLVKDQAQISNVRLYPGSRLILKDQAQAMLVYNYGGAVEGRSMDRCSFAATLSEDLYFDQEVAIFEQACHKRMQVANGGKAIAFYGSTTIDTRVRSRGIFIAKYGSTHIGMKVCAGGILVAMPGAKLIDLVTDKDSEVYFLNGAIMIQPRLQGTVYTKTGEVKDLDVASTVVNWLPHNGNDLSFFSLKQYNEEELANVTSHSVCL